MSRGGSATIIDMQSACHAIPFAACLSLYHVNLKAGRGWPLRSQSPFAWLFVLHNKPHTRRKWVRLFLVLKIASRRQSCRASSNVSRPCGVSVQLCPP